MWKLERKLHSGTSKPLLTQAQGRQAQSPLHPPPTKLAAGSASMTSFFQIHNTITKGCNSVVAVQDFAALIMPGKGAQTLSNTDHCGH